MFKDNRQIIFTSMVNRDTVFEDIKKAALASIKNGNAMYASCDMPQFDAASGIASTGLHDYESLFGIDLDMDKKARILTREP